MDGSQDRPQTDWIPPALRHATPHVSFLEPDERTDRPVLGVIAGAERTLIVDAGNSAAHVELLLRHLAAARIAPPGLAAITHWHWDHVFGIAALGVPTFAHVETRRIVSEMASLDWSDEALDRRVEQGLEIAFCRDMIRAELPDRTGLVLRPPDIGFTERVEIDLGGIECHVVHVGGDHSADSSIVYVPEDRIAFLGDCLSPDIHRGVYTAAKALRLMDRLLALDADLYLEGHATAPMTRAELQGYARLFASVVRLTQEETDRAAVLRQLQEHLGTELNEEHLKIVDAFLTGKDKV
jgi:glyoxylase-like metal-dependent hydrolase (beta-lactamase superfamily II)